MLGLDLSATGLLPGQPGTLSPDRAVSQVLGGEESMQACCRCKNAAGFWVMAKDARVVRRPWCLSCINEFLDTDDVTMTTIEAVPRTRPRLRLDRPPRPPRIVTDRAGQRTASATIRCSPREAHYLASLASA